MNKVILCGRLTRDPEVRYGGSDQRTAIARYTLAVDKIKKKGEEKSADFINCVALGKIGEFAQMYLHQGMKILVCGSWQTGSYTNKEGTKVYTNECLVQEHHFCDGKSQNGNQNMQPYQNQSSIGDGFMQIPDNIEDSGLPFN